MAANPVTQYGAYGYWKALNSAGVTITNDSLFNTTVKVLAGRTATMIWTTGNGTCAATTDTVLLTNYAVPNKAAAGPTRYIVMIPSLQWRPIRLLSMVHTVTGKHSIQQV
jgi:hypothetical protein